MSTATERRIIGPPGTGKTTTLSKKITKACSIYGGEAVLVSSFTKAAAQELVARELPIGPGRVGTLHSMCYRMLGSPQIAEEKAAEFNAQAEFAHHVKTSSGNIGDELFGDTRAETPGSASQARYELLRAQMAPRPYPTTVEAFAVAWEAWKKATGYMDFTDLIEEALHGPHGLPKHAFVGYFDEVQDFSPLELALVRKWSKLLRVAVLAFDTDQLIFSFRGARAEALLTPIDPAHVHVLGKSYRLPSVVKDYAENWISRVAVRADAPFEARCKGGAVERIRADYLNPANIVSDIRERTAAGETCMVLGSCAFHLNATIKELKAAGIPIHNPYRVKNGAWNPMRGGVRRLANFLLPRSPQNGGQGRLWTWEELWSVVEFLDAKKCGFDRGAKEGLHMIAKDDDAREAPVTPSEFRAVLGVDLFPTDVDWLRDHVLDRRLSFFDYGANIVKHDPLLLTKEPKVVVGTIHSVKGGQADNVYIYPDLSKRGAKELLSQDGEDSITRCFYVALTRAKERVVLCSPLRTSLSVKGL